MYSKTLSQIKSKSGGLRHFNLFFVVLSSLLLLLNRIAKADLVFMWLYFGVLFTGIIRIFLPARTADQPPTAKHNEFPVLSFVLITVCYAPFFLNPLNSAQDWAIPTKPLLNSISLVPSVWESHMGGADLGHSQGSALWLLPIWSTISLASRFVPNYSLLTKVITAFFLIVGFMGVRKLLSLFEFSSLAIFIGSVFYLVNTYILTLIDGGNLFIAFAYCSFPSLIYLLYSTSRKSTLKLGLLLSVTALFDFRFLILFVVATLSSLSTRIIKKSMVASLLTVLVHLFWIVPVVTQVYKTNFSYSNVSQVDQFSLSSLGHLLFFSQPHWFNNNFGDIQPVRWYFFPVAALAVYALSRPTIPRNRFFIAIFITGLFLTKGNQPPLGQIYTFAFDYLPFFAIFRDPSKFTTLTALGFAGLIAVGTHTLSRRFHPLILVLLTIYFLGLTIPIYSNSLSGTFSANPFQKTYSDLASHIESSSFSRILWIPTKSPAAWVNRFPIHTEAITLLSKQPYLTMVNGTYELANYLRTPGIEGLLDISGIKYLAYPYPDVRKHELKTDQIDYFYWYNKWLGGQPWLTDISTSPDLKVYSTKQSVDRLFAPTDISLITGTDNIYKFFSGFPDFQLRDHIMVHLPSLSLPKIHVNLIFYESDALNLALSNLPKSSIYQISNLVSRSGKSQGDWWSRSSQDYLFVKNYLTSHYNLDYSDTDLGLGYLIVEGEHELSLPGFPASGDLYLRFLTSHAGGTLEITTAQKTVLVNTLGSGDNFHWIKISAYQAHSPLRLFSRGSVNLLNSIAIISPDQVEKLISTSHQDIANSNIIEIVNPSLGSNILNLTSSNPTLKTFIRIPPLVSESLIDLEINDSRFVKLISPSLLVQWLDLGKDLQINEPQKIKININLMPSGTKIVFFSTSLSSQKLSQINYSQISQTKYQFNITSPGPVVFSESFDPSWQLLPSHQKPFPAYDMLNGYYIDSPGNYTLQYLPQQIVTPLFIVSLVLFLILVTTAFIM